MKSKTITLPGHLRLEMLNEIIRESSVMKNIPSRLLKKLLTPAEYENCRIRLRSIEFSIPAPIHIRRLLQEYTALVGAADKLQDAVDKLRRSPPRWRRTKTGIPSTILLRSRADVAYQKAFEFIEELYADYPCIHMWLDRKVDGEDVGESAEHIPRTIWSRSRFSRMERAFTRHKIVREALLRSRDRLRENSEHDEGEQIHSPLSCHSFGDEDPYLPRFPDFDDVPLL